MPARHIGGRVGTWVHPGQHTNQQAARRRMSDELPLLTGKASSVGQMRSGGASSAADAPEITLQEARRLLGGCQQPVLYHAHHALDKRPHVPAGKCVESHQTEDMCSACLTCMSIEGAQRLSEEGSKLFLTGASRPVLRGAAIRRAALSRRSSADELPKASSEAERAALRP